MRSLFHSMRLWAIALVATLGVGCAGPELSHYDGKTPAFEPREFFSGPIVAHGVLKNRAGEVTRHFKATIDASWNEEGIGTLDERFVFDDGEVQYRTWTLTPTGPGQFDATAGDVIGTGKGRTNGNALKLDYVLEIDYQGDKLQLNVEDWMWRLDENTVLNQSTLTKWGFKVGTIQLVMKKQAGP